jgi:phosphoribosylformylglycinamidine synthase
VLVAGAAQRLFKSAHDCAEGGVAVTLAECCFSGTPGVDADLAAIEAEAGFGDIATLFGESASRAVVSVAAGREREALELAGNAGVPAAVIGRVGGGRVRLSIGGRRVIDEAVDAAERIWDGAIASRFERTVA